LILPALGFIVCAAAILWAGTRLAAYADVIALRSNLGRVWAGMILLAVATSLPELVNSTSAGLQNLPDIAAGDVGGSNIVNFVIIGLVDVLGRTRSCLGNLHSFHSRSIAFLMVMSALAAGATLLGPHFPVLFWFSPFTVVIILLYVLAVRKAHSAEETAALAPTIPTISLRQAVVRYLLFALVVVVAACLLPTTASYIADHTGLGNTFVGTLMVALATSLPELVTAVAAVRIGAVEMAVGGILGSNLFNLTILGIVDLFYWRDSLFAAIDGRHSVPFTLGIVLAGLFYLVLRRCPSRRFLRITWFGWAALAVYLANTAFLYLTR
jgi:cation:H+ antiporter